MDPLKVSIVKAWDRGVEDYDDLVAHGRLTRTEADAWKAVLTRLLPPLPSRVLEVGAGTGVMSVLLGELGYQVTATDISRGMLQEARRKAAELTLAGVERLLCPTLVVFGKLDRIIPYSEAERTAAIPGVELVTFETGNHGVTDEAFASRSLMADWLARRLGGRSSGPTICCSWPSCYANCPRVTVSEIMP